MEIGTQTGPYRIDALLGKGGMAEVYKAWHTGLHRFEAMKVLPPQMTFDKSFVERFLNEARMAAGLQHPNIATIHTVSDADAGQPYFTMEIVDGGDLADMLEARGRFSLQEALPILRQIGAALDFAHGRGLIHRDVKPANVLLKSDGNDSHVVKVVDFGIARAQEEAGGKRLTKTGMIVGTPEYMSPEQGGSGAPVDHRTDQYSLAVIAYEMLCGQPPFKSEGDTSMLSVIMQHVRDEPRPPIEYSMALSKAANAAILKALAKNPADRFDSCDAFSEALGGTTVVKPVKGALPVRPPQKRVFPLVPVALGVLAFAGAGLIGYGLNNRSNGIVEVVPPTPIEIGDSKASSNGGTGEPSKSVQSTPVIHKAPPPSKPTPVPMPSTLVGTWTGTWPWIDDHVRSQLVVTGQQGDSFDAVLTVFFGRGPSQVNMRGYVSSDGIVELTETSLAYEAKVGDWGDLNVSAGQLSLSRKRILGHLKLYPRKKWEFEWVGASTSIPSRY